MSRKKILWLCSWYPSKFEPFNGDFIQRHARAAALENDIHVIHVTYDYPKGAVSPKQEVTSEHGLTEHIIYFKKKKSALFTVKNQLKWAATFKKAIRNYIVKNGKPDLVHLHIPVKAGWLALWVKRNYKIPYLVTEHWGIYNNVLEENFESKNPLLKSLIRKVFQSASVFISVSHFLGDIIKHRFGLGQYTVIPNTVDTSCFFYTAKEKKGFEFIHVSNMVPLKNVEGILQSFKKLVDQAPQVRLKIVGETNTAIQALAAKLNFANGQVQFTGEISYPEVAIEMQKADCLVLFSTIENAPCVISEALCCGLPVIATSVGGIPELVSEENGILVASKDEAALTSAMQFMVSSSEKFDRKKIAQQATALYSYATIGQAFDKEYEKLIKSNT